MTILINSNLLNIFNILSSCEVVFSKSSEKKGLNDDTHDINAKLKDSTTGQIKFHEMYEFKLGFSSL
jgi:hypothetical protein